MNRGIPFDWLSTRGNTRAPDSCLFLVHALLLVLSWNHRPEKEERCHRVNVMLEDTKREGRLSLLFGYPFSLRCSLKYLPLLSSILLVTTLFVAFTLCYRYGHLPPEFPSPSDTGVFQPESSWFTFGFFWAMIALAISVLKNSLLLSQFYEPRKGIELTALRIATTCGVLAAVSGTVPACFQVGLMEV